MTELIVALDKIVDAHITYIGDGDIPAVLDQDALVQAIAKFIGTLSEKDKPMTDSVERPYRVEIDDSDVCPRCGRGPVWDIIGPDDVALGVSYGDKEDAEDMAESLSCAFEAGMAITLDTMRDVIARHSAPPTEPQNVTKEEEHR